MAQRDQQRRLLGGLNARDPGHREHVALADGSAGDERRRVGPHQHLATGDRPAVRRLLRGDVDHSGATQRVEVGEALGHEPKV